MEEVRDVMIKKNVSCVRPVDRPMWPTARAPTFADLGGGAWCQPWACTNSEVTKTNLDGKSVKMIKQNVIWFG